MRGGAVVARVAHNHEVAGSNPAPATEYQPSNRDLTEAENMAKSNVVATDVRKSGTHAWAHLEAEDPKDLGFFARLFHKSVQTDARGCHIDVSEHQRSVALAKGAKAGRINPPTLNE